MGDSLSEDISRMSAEEIITYLEKRIGPRRLASAMRQISRADMLKKLREAERYAIGAPSHVHPQAGLPSLGKKRP